MSARDESTARAQVKLIQSASRGFEEAPLDEAMLDKLALTDSGRAFFADEQKRVELHGDSPIASYLEQRSATPTAAEAVQQASWIPEPLKQYLGFRAAGGALERKIAEGIQNGINSAAAGISKAAGEKIQEHLGSGLLAQQAQLQVNYSLGLVKGATSAVTGLFALEGSIYEGSFSESLVRAGQRGIEYTHDPSLAVEDGKKFLGGQWNKLKENPGDYVGQIGGQALVGVATGGAGLAVNGAGGVAKVGAALGKAGRRAPASTDQLVLASHRGLESKRTVVAAQAQLTGDLSIGVFERARLMETVETALADPSAKVINHTPLGGGVNETHIVTLSNGVKAVWKPASGESGVKLRSNLSPGHQAQREAAAYLVDKAMYHHGGVMPTVYRELDGRPGTLLAYVNDVKPLSAGSRGSTRITVLDHVLGNLDRHAGNLVQKGDDLVPIDHGLAFPTKHGDQGYHNFIFDKPVALDLDTRGRLQQVLDSRATLTQDLRRIGIEGPAIRLMFSRVEQMLKNGQTSNEWRSAPSKKPEKNP